MQLGQQISHSRGKKTTTSRQNPGSSLFVSPCGHVWRKIASASQAFFLFIERIWALKHEISIASMFEIACGACLATLNQLVCEGKRIIKG